MQTVEILTNDYFQILTNAASPLASCFNVPWIYGFIHIRHSQIMFSSFMVIKTKLAATMHENMMETCINARLLVILVFWPLIGLFSLFTSVLWFCWEIIHPQ